MSIHNWRIQLHESNYVNLNAQYQKSFYKNIDIKGVIKKLKHNKDYVKKYLIFRLPKIYNKGNLNEKERVTMQPYEIKEQILELENQIAYFQETLKEYEHCESLPPFLLNAERQIELFEAKIKELNEQLFDSIQKPNSPGRPSLGTTKKVSLTLPDKVWEEIEERKEQNAISQSQAIKDMLEYACHFPKDVASPIMKERRFADFKNFVVNADLSKLRYHLFKFGLVIISKVEKVELKHEDAGVEIHFNGGHVTIWKENMIHKCPRPSNLITDCEACYSLCNEYEEHIGYLYIPKEKGETVK